MSRANLNNQQIQERKKLLRQKYLTQRQKISWLQWHQQSENICNHLVNSKIFAQAKVILSYLSFRQEPDLSILHQKRQYTWGIPRCQGKDLIWHRYQQGDELVKGNYGV